MGNVVTQVLVTYAGMDVDFPVDDYWKFSFLCTEEEALQDPHIDYKWKALETHDNTAKWMYPYSLDLPLTDGGLQLAVWGPDTGDDDFHIPPEPHSDCCTSQEDATMEVRNALLTHVYFSY